MALARDRFRASDSSIPVRGSGIDGPELRRGLREFHGDLGKPGVERAAIGDLAFTFVAVERVDDADGLAQRDLGAQHQESPVGAYGDRESFLTESLAISRFPAN
jgi:hypothetical protein